MLRERKTCQKELMPKVIVLHKSMIIMSSASPFIIRHNGGFSEFDFHFMHLLYDLYKLEVLNMSLLCYYNIL